ncbi:hypothetical protein GPJ56_005309 [Histomonas meleagridis]|uniref:uncharacterized protein n=1 Tax=Histomonas meleagridis TaxID=135588 RepID=UPI00355A6876|nr:hypothetical protein GPJ56_005309 [Histomonas meleagridis]KAH0796289.1 hypothetical protein GO595_010182 [Histomonas meleagridis]
MGSIAPYVFLGILALFIVLCIYVWKHKEEILEKAGIELPPALQGFRKKEKNQRIHPNSKGLKKLHKSKPAPSQEVKKAPNPKPKNIKKNDESKEPKNKEDDRISDLTIQTQDSPISSLMINNPGTLLICNTKSHTSFLFAVGSLDFGLYPFKQQFQLSEDDILALASIQLKDNFQILYALSTQKCIQSSAITFNDEAKAVTSKGQFEVNNAFQKSIQKLLATPDGDHVFALTDHELFTIYSNTGQLQFQQSFPQKKCHDFQVSRDFKKLYISTNCNIECYSIENIGKPNISLKKISAVTTNSIIISLTYFEKTKQITCAAIDGSISVFKEKMEQGTALRFNSTGVRIIRASPTSTLMAVISQKSKLQIVDIKSGTLLAQLDEVHKGDVHFIEWATKGNWIFVASKTKPGIEIFSTSLDKK